MNRDQYLAKRELLYGKSFATEVLPARGGRPAAGDAVAGAQVYRVRTPIPVSSGNFDGPPTPAPGWVR